MSSIFINSRIDSHSHFGKDCFWSIEGNVDKYIKNAKENKIAEVYAMSVPCPVIMHNNSKKILSIYELEGKEFKHYSVEERDGNKICSSNLLGINPYKLANDYIYDISKKENGIKIHYVPLLHPYYYSSDDILEHIKRGVKMFKIHGIACGVIPELIDEKFFRIIEYYQVPLLVHTDYSNEENIFSYNNARSWLKVLSKYNIKVYFAHAARLDRYAIDMINSDSRYIVGLGPDKLLSNNGQNVFNCRNYLEYCLNCFNDNKVVFDLDYPWNVENTDNYITDWNSVYRVKSLINKEQQEKVFKKNIESFLK